MPSVGGKALVKVTFGAPKRSIDVALPEDVPVAELLPYVLRHAGDDAADSGERHGGWTVRRLTGKRLDNDRTLGAQEVRDGEVLWFVPGQEEWPELEYDDVVEAIAHGARRHGRSWGPAATRRCGLVACCALLIAGTSLTAGFGPPWSVPGLVMLGAAGLLLVIGTVVARSVPDATAGAVFGGCGLLYAFIGGFLLSGPDGVPLGGFGVPQLGLGATTLLVAGLIGYVGITAAIRVFAAAITAGLLVMLGVLFAGDLAADGVAAVILTTGIALLPAYPLLAVRLGRLPLPSLPQRPADLLEDKPTPAATDVFDAAIRADEILSGLLLGLSLVSVVAAMFLIADGGGARVLMTGTVALALLLRARLFPVLRQRIPMLVAGILVAVMLASAFTFSETSAGTRALFLLAVVATAGGIAASGLIYSRKDPSPYLGRIADIVDVVALLALIPLACYIVGFFTYVQGLMASLG